MQSFDRNQDGVLQKLEFEEFMSQLGVFLSRQELRVVFDNFDQNKEWEKLARYMPIVQGGQYGGSSTAQQPIFGNSLAQNAGLGLGAASVFGQLFGKNGSFGNVFGV